MMYDMGISGFGDVVYITDMRCLFIMNIMGCGHITLIWWFESHGARYLVWMLSDISWKSESHDIPLDVKWYIIYHVKWYLMPVLRKSELLHKALCSTCKRGRPAEGTARPWKVPLSSEAVAVGYEPCIHRKVFIRLLQGVKIFMVTDTSDEDERALIAVLHNAASRNQSHFG